MTNIFSATTIILSAATTSALRLAVVSKIIVDTIEGRRRLGGGGVQAAVGAMLAVPSLETSLHTPVGADFDFAMLSPSPATEHDVDVSAVTPLPQVATTPGELISYDGPDDKMCFTPVGWDGWPQLCEWVPPLAGAPYDALHVIVEGAGGGEVEAALGAMAAASSLLSVEPVMHRVSANSVDGLARLTRLASVVSPDLSTAACIGGVHSSRAVAEGATEAAPGGVTGASGAAADAELELRPADAVSELTSIRSGENELRRLSSACFDALRMQPGAILAIRDGERGSYVYTRPYPLRSQPAESTGEEDWFITVPAVTLEVVADPTGAGNAYAAAFCAQLAAGAEVRRAAAVASAVGAAFCRATDWAPSDVDEARGWVRSESEQLWGVLAA